MPYLRWTAVIALCACSLFATVQVIRVAYAQVTAPMAVPVTAKLEVIHGGLDTEGRPETLGQCEVGLFKDQALTQLARSVQFPMQAGLSTFELSQVWSTQLPGVYYLSARASDAAGNLNPVWYTPAVAVNLDKYAPAQFTGMKVVLSTLTQ